MSPEERAALVATFRLEIKRDRRRHRLDPAPHGADPPRFQGDPRNMGAPTPRMTRAQQRSFWARINTRVPHDAPARSWVINHGLTDRQIRARARRMRKLERDEATDAAIAGRRGRSAANRAAMRRRRP